MLITAFYLLWNIWNNILFQAFVFKAIFKTTQTNNLVHHRFTIWLMLEYRDQWFDIYLFYFYHCQFYQVMPLLEVLYQSQERSSHHIYMGLIILLVLTEDSLFNKAVHEIVSWSLTINVFSIKVNNCL